MSSLYLEATAHYGFLIPHHNEMWALTDGYFPVWELSIVYQSDGRKYSDYLRKYPRYGLSYLYSDFGNSQALGDMHALVPNLSINLISHRKFSFAVVTGLGLAYLSKKFHPINNYQNLAIGSMINAAIQLEMKMRWELTPSFQFNSGVSFLHLSNGTIKTPNYGLNTPALFAGFTWKLNKKEIYYKTPERISQNKGKMDMRVMVSVASKQIAKEWEKNFGVIAATAYFSRYYNNTNKILLGADVVYDESVQYALQQDGEPSDQWMDVSKIGISIGNEWTFSRLSANVCLGYYLHKSAEDDDIIYNKLGLTYDFLKFAFVGVNLQTHWAKADFLSFGIGFKI